MVDDGHPAVFQFDEARHDGLENFDHRPPILLPAGFAQRFEPALDHHGFNGPDTGDEVALPALDNIVLGLVEEFFGQLFSGAQAGDGYRDIATGNETGKLDTERFDTSLRQKGCPV